MGLEDLSSKEDSQMYNYMCTACGEYMIEKTEHLDITDGPNGKRYKCTDTGQLASVDSISDSPEQESNGLYSEFKQEVGEVNIYIYLYVLELKVKGEKWYYVGSTTNPSDRLDTHENANGSFKARREISNNAYISVDMDFEILGLYDAKRVPVPKQMESRVGKVKPATEAQAMLELCLEEETTNILGGR